VSERSFGRSWDESDLKRGDLSSLRDFAYFRNRHPPSIVVDRLCDHGLMAITNRGRKRMTLKGWIAIFSQKTFAQKN
jgi:hypothetical protein